MRGYNLWTDDVVQDVLSISLFPFLNGVLTTTRTQSVLANGNANHLHCSLAKPITQNDHIHVIAVS